MRLSLLDDAARVEARAELSRFRRDFYACLTSRSDVLFELADAVLCTTGPVVSLAELSLEAVHRRGHGAMYDALAHGRIAVSRLRMALAGLVLPRGQDGQLSIAVDVTPWPRPDAECSPQRLHCHRPCRCDGTRQTIPGWPYQVASALGGGRCSWTGPLDAVRIGPAEDPTEVTATQIRDLLARLREAGQWREGDPPVLFVLDSGYDLVRLTWLLSEEPVRLLGRIRADRVMHAPAGRRRGDRPGRPPKHGAAFRLTDPATHPAPAQESTGHHDRFGRIVARCWGRLHPKLERRGAWANHEGEVPIVEGTLVHLAVECLPGNRNPKPLWLWHSDPDAAVHDVDRLWRIYLRGRLRRLCPFRGQSKHAGLV
ncbi:transposase, partial [Micromonospora sp. CPCC 206060]